MYKYEILVTRTAVEYTYIQQYAYECSYSITKSCTTYETAVARVLDCTPHDMYVVRVSFYTPSSKTANFLSSDCCSALLVPILVLPGAAAAAACTAADWRPEQTVPQHTRTQTLLCTLLYTLAMHNRQGEDQR